MICPSLSVFQGNFQVHLPLSLGNSCSGLVWRSSEIPAQAMGRQRNLLAKILGLKILDASFSIVLVFFLDTPYMSNMVDEQKQFVNHAPKGISRHIFCGESSNLINLG